MKNLICLGDSITADEISEDGTERLTPRLRSALTGWNVINAGVSGDNSKDALLRLNGDVLALSPDLVTVLLGANDAAFHKTLDLKEYKSNLQTIVTGIGAKKVILLSPAPVDEKREPNRKNAVMAKYANAAKAVALTYGARFIDLFAEMLKLNDYEDMLSDGLHFTAYGYKFLAGVIGEEIQKEIQSPKK